MAWKIGLGAQQARRGAHGRPRHGQPHPRHGQWRPRHGQGRPRHGWQRARGLARGLCRDIINCIVTKGSLVAGLYRDVARSNAAIRCTELRYAWHSAGRGALGTAAIQPRGGLRHGRCWATIRRHYDTPNPGSLGIRIPKL